MLDNRAGYNQGVFSGVLGFVLLEHDFLLLADMLTCQ